MKKIISAIAVLALLFTGCKKETPKVSDNIPPEITLAISTTGWSHTFKSTDIVGGIWELRLTPNTVYTYTISSTDSASGLRNLDFRITRGTGGYWQFNCSGAPEAPRENVTATAYLYSLNPQLYKSYLMRGSFRTGNSANNSRNFQIQLTSSDNSDPANTSQISIPVAVPFSGDYGWINIFG